MSGRYIAIAGNMGAGKSSLVEFLCKHFKVKPFFEPNATNPYLDDFYKDMKAYAFHSQMYFLSQKFKMHQELAHSKEAVVQDRTIFEDAEIFATNLYKQGLIAERDFKVYKAFYQSIVRSIRPPDLLIYLKCSLPTIKKRVGQKSKIPLDNSVIPYIAYIVLSIWPERRPELYWIRMCFTQVFIPQKGLLLRY